MDPPNPQPNPFHISPHGPSVPTPPPYGFRNGTGTGPWRDTGRRKGRERSVTGVMSSVHFAHCFHIPVNSFHILRTPLALVTSLPEGS